MKKNVKDEIKLEEIIDDPQLPDYYSENRTERKKGSIEKWFEYFQKNKYKEEEVGRE